MFQLTENEWQNLTSQFVISSWGGRRTLPNVFTEHGILMLSSVLNSSQAIQVNIQVVRIFVRLRQIFASQNELKIEIEDIKQKLNNQDKNIELVFSYLDELSEKKSQPRKSIGFKPDELLVFYSSQTLRSQFVTSKTIRFFYVKPPISPAITPKPATFFIQHFGN